MWMAVETFRKGWLVSSELEKTDVKLFKILIITLTHYLQLN